MSIHIETENRLKRWTGKSNHQSKGLANIGPFRSSLIPLSLVLSMELKSSLGLTGSNIGPFEEVSRLCCCGREITGTGISWRINPTAAAVVVIVVSVVSRPGRVTNALDNETVRGVKSESVSVSRTGWWLM